MFQCGLGDYGIGIIVNSFFFKDGDDNKKYDYGDDVDFLYENGYVLNLWI